MQKKFQIFVSSTYQDLIEERRAVIEAILDLGHIPIGMEAFQASNEEQWSYIKKRIDEADYYVVIVAERYGSTNDQGVSFTEMEYDYAREKGVPVAAFLLHEDARSEWRKNKVDTIDNRVKLESFRKKCQTLMVRYWKEKYDLAASFIKSISHLMNSMPRNGWIPASSAIDNSILSELSSLRRERDAAIAEYNRVLFEIGADSADDIRKVRKDVDALRRAYEKLLIEAESHKPSATPYLPAAHPPRTRSQNSVTLRFHSISGPIYLRDIEITLRSIRELYNFLLAIDCADGTILFWPRNDTFGFIEDEIGIPNTARLRVTHVENGSIIADLSSGKPNIIGRVVRVLGLISGVGIGKLIADFGKARSESNVAQATESARIKRIIEEEHVLLEKAAAERRRVWQASKLDQVEFFHKLTKKAGDDEIKRRLLSKIDQCIDQIIDSGMEVSVEEFNADHHVID